eukprot:m.765644 g.765644  ORF g.765644 m.765644 type:complete len:55 (-) comp23220_c1_seq63:220-384(-)
MELQTLVAMQNERLVLAMQRRKHRAFLVRRWGDSIFYENLCDAVRISIEVALDN